MTILLRLLAPLGLAELATFAGCRFGFPAQDLGDATSNERIDGQPDGAPDRPNRIFMTFPGSDGNLGGLVGADAKCQAAADSKALEGKWQALLWTAAGGPSLRFAGSRGWVDLAGTQIADRAEDLDYNNLNPLLLDESGSSIAGRYAWRGDMDFSCADWTDQTNVATPRLYESEASWDNDSYSSCPSIDLGLLCAEVGHVAPVIPVVHPGRIAFVSETFWVPTGGLAAADAVCQGEANAAGVPGTFLALLATSSATAESRFSATGLPWQRVDGVRITNTADELVGPGAVNVWSSFIARSATGAVNNNRIWYGSPTAHCNNWNPTGAAAGDYGQSHFALRSRLGYFNPVDCVNGAALICLQQ